MPANPAPPFADPEPHGFIYLGFHADKPQKSPLYHQTPTRRREATRLVEAAKAISRRPDVHSVRVFRALLIPPMSGAPRHDLAMLIRTAQTDDLDHIRQTEEIKGLDGEEILAGLNAARIGETEADLDATFLFNHFAMTGEADPEAAWRSLTGWYTSKIGVDNSTALRPTGSSRFALVNYVRLPTAPPLFLLNQILRPSFHRVVRGTLKTNGMRALPGFYRMVR
ncbi:hypothetical protein [Nonomuraea dietziae]|uniref:hypothetical protein n=1 Tax=Nonomuraea dietziae TaxID=65515 RepID=UPI00342ED200